MSWEISNASGFAALAQEWDQLNRRLHNSPILESRFVSPLLTEFGNGSELLCRYRSGRRTTAMAVITKNSFGNWSTFQPSQAPIGLWLCDPEEGLERLLNSLTKEIPGFCAIFSLLQIDSGHIEKPKESNRLTTLDYIQTARIATGIGFEAYSAGRSKNLRKNLRKQQNKLLDNYQAPELKVIRQARDVATAIRTYGELESAGWKAETNTAIHPDNAQGKFYSAILENFCETGDGLIYQYQVGDETAATDLCIRNEETVVILKTTFNESLKDYSPALLMHHEIFRDIFENSDLNTIEFYGKVMDWHTKWSDDYRDIYHLNFFKYPLLKRIRSLIRKNK